jgi:hypothetical protein
MTKKIKLMLDYGCYPLWWYDSEQVGNIDPKSLPLSSEMIQHLTELAEKNDATLNWDDPSESEELTEAEIRKLDKELSLLKIKLQKELYPDYEVVYFSEKLGKVSSSKKSGKRPDSKISRRRKALPSEFLRPESERKNGALPNKGLTKPKS